MSEFAFMAEVPVNPTKAELFTAWKEQLGMWTFHSPGVEEPWLAMCVPRAHEVLKGYDLTEKEKSDPVELYMGYCRLIYEAGISETGDTEDEACARVAKNLEFVQPPSL